MNKKINFKKLYFELVNLRREEEKSITISVTNNIDKIDKIKWQINAETSLTQIMLWAIVIKIFGGLFITILGIICIIGNVITLTRSGIKLGKDYFK